MDIQSIGQKIRGYQKDGKRLFATSSFQTHSVVLLHILSHIDKSIPIYFINTGYHFAETIRYKDTVSQKLGIKVIDLHSHVPKVMQTNGAGNLMFTYDPDYCCYLNKVQPVESLLDQYDVWINGIRAQQNEYRSRFKVEDSTTGKILRFHPLIAWSTKKVESYIKEHDLPIHPLESKGYKSIGCEPCTRPTNGTNIRDARWAGMQKTECGLHKKTFL